MQTARTVLVIDDDRAVRESVEELLRESGFEVRTAGNGFEALELLGQGLRPSVILLDLVMPTMDGWDFRQAQLSDPSLKDIPTILTTASGFSEQTLRAQFAGVHVVLKPSSPAELVQAIRHLSESRRDT